MKNLNSLLLTMLMFMCGLTVSAYDFEDNGIYYSITSEANKTVEVTFSSTKYASYAGAVSFPKLVAHKHATYRVTGIGKSAFRDCSNLTSVSIPKSVETIGDSAFYNCSSLTTLSIPNSVTDIGNWAFFHCSGLTALTLGNNVERIGSWAFFHCSGLSSVTIPSSVVLIGDRAFSECFGLTSLIIPNNVSEIGENAFFWCSDLTSVTIGSGVKTIGNNAFSRCVRLKDVSALALSAIICENNIFDMNKFEDATLYIPEGAMDAYMKTAPWGNFENVQERFFQR